MLYWTVLLIGAASATTVRLDHYESLDFKSAKGDARWGINSTHIEMELTYPTKGWVAFGLSPDGQMDDADFLFGYVNDTTKEVVVQDRHEVEDHHTAHDTMVMDTHHDWMRISGMQNNTHTVIRAVRKLQTCDKKDHPFTLDTQHAVFAMDVRDPSSKTASVPLENAKTGTESIDFSRHMSAADIKAANHKC